MNILATKTGRILTTRGLTLSVCESCTGGMLGSVITGIPGSSNYFIGGIIAYSNEMKIKFAGVKSETIKKYGAVSKQTAREMALGTKELTGSDISIAITGIAGPGGGTKVKPVGLVYIAIAIDNKIIVVRNLFKGSRQEIRKRACECALKLLIEHLGRKK
ncbi:MAG: CinA family protein [candidate division WOR-3 bacterium]|nr:CinA family protein [candidate division WOR-3 bacterium]